MQAIQQKLEDYAAEYHKANKTAIELQTRITAAQKSRAQADSPSNELDELCFKAQAIVQHDSVKLESLRHLVGVVERIQAWKAKFLLDGKLSPAYRALVDAQSAASVRLGDVAAAEAQLAKVEQRKAYIEQRQRFYLALLQRAIAGEDVSSAAVSSTTSSSSAKSSSSSAQSVRVGQVRSSASSARSITSSRS